MVSTPLGRQVGYARVSTDEQNLDLQVQALQRVGCDLIYSDKGISGGVRQRPGLIKALNALRQGDKLIVWRLDRLGRSLVHLVQLLDELGERKIGFQSLCEAVDTSTSGGKLVFHMMAALAEFERSLISERTRAGMAAARLRGKHIGRFPSLTIEECKEAQALLGQGQSPEIVAEHFNVKPRTLLRLVKRLRLTNALISAEASQDLAVTTATAVDELVSIPAEFSECTANAHNGRSDAPPVFSSTGL
ncbi:invertase [Comamonas thiooxydans]|nr:invertase [Comamonas thiooxydans]